jgi:hypothetical protein
MDWSGNRAREILAKALLQAGEYISADDLDGLNIANAYMDGGRAYMISAKITITRLREAE